MSFNLLTLLDDIAATLDDVSVMTKMAIKKTSGIITDDLALNVGQVDGVSAKEELPTVFKIFLGSLVNKAIIIPFVLALTYYAPIILGYILLLGGLYLSYEGAHKVADKLFQSKEKHNKKIEDIPVKDKVWGAIKTDFVLSIEILVIAQSSISGPIFNQSLVLATIGLSVSILIYGIVALLVKIDDFGLYLVKKKFQKIGLFLIRLMPKIMKGLGLVGTTAMFIVGGGIFSHHFNLHFLEIEIIQNIIVGLIVGFLAVITVSVISKLRSIKTKGLC